MKQREGWLNEEFVTCTSHYFENGRVSTHVNEPFDGEYTGRFHFQYKDGRITRWYTVRTAPKWPLAIYREATLGAENAHA